MSILSIAIFYSLLSLGLNMQWGFTGLPNFGYHAFFALGAYASAILTLNGIPIPIGFLCGMAISCLAALLLGASTLKLRGDYFFIGSLIFGEIIWFIFNNEYWLTNGPNGLPGIPHLFGESGGTVYLFAFFGILIAVVCILYLLLERFVKSPYGRVLQAMREDEVVVASVGKNVFRFRLECFLISAIIASLSGSFFAHFMGFVAPRQFTAFVTFYVMICLLVGGLGNNKGAIIGAFIIEAAYDGLRFLGDLTGGTIATQIASLRIILVAVILILVMLKFPRGILGAKE